MIARVWRGHTLSKDANAYEALLRPDPVPGLTNVRGYIGSYILRRPQGTETEFVVMTLFDSLESIVLALGQDYQQSIVPENRAPYLTRHDKRAAHYEIAGVHGMGLAL